MLPVASYHIFLVLIHATASLVENASRLIFTIYSFPEVSCVGFCWCNVFMVNAEAHIVREVATTTSAMVERTESCLVVLFFLVFYKVSFVSLCALLAPDPILILCHTFCTQR